MDFGVVRDPIACKPAVMAETDQYVAFGSEYRALVNLPGLTQRASGNRNPQLFISGHINMQTFDLEEQGLRALNQTLHGQANRHQPDKLGNH